jgi:hypothetical protein
MKYELVMIWHHLTDMNMGITEFTLSWLMHKQVLLMFFVELLRKKL